MPQRGPLQGHVRQWPMGHGALVDLGEQLWPDFERPRALSDDQRRLQTDLAAVVDEPSLHRQVAAR